MLTKTTVKRLIEKSGAKHVSGDAAEELSKILEKKALEISKKAAALAKYSGRRTVMKKDIKMAAKEFSYP